MFKRFFRFITQPMRVLDRVGVHHFDRLYERILNNEKSLKWVALLIIIIMYVSMKFTPNLSLSYAEDVRGKTLGVIYDETSYVVEGLPKTIDVTLQGKESLVRNVITTNKFNTYVDLTGLKPGQHLVDIKYDLIPSGLMVDMNPKNVLILIHELVQAEKKVDYELLNQETLDPTVVLSNFNLSNQQVIVKGSKEAVEKTTKIKAYINLSEIPELKQGNERIGTHEVTVPLYALDAEGNKLNVQMEPSEVNITFESSIPQKTVQLKPRLMGELPEGKVVRSIDLSPSEITIYAQQSILDSINDLPFDIDLSQMSDGYEAVFSISTPDNVPKISTDQIQVKLNLETAHERTFKGVKIGVQGLASGLVVKDVDKLMREVTIKGVSETVQSFDEKELLLVIDVSELSIGKHEVAIQLLNQKSNLIYTYPEKIEVELKKEEK